jgi:peptide/nickel transport system permease protein
MAVPEFLIGVILILVFSRWLGVLPSRGYFPLGDGVGENLSRMLLPSLTLALAHAPVLLRFLRASMFEMLGSSFVRTAQGKGVSRRKLVTSHVLGNSLVPALTIVGLLMGGLLGGAVVVEYVFGMSGIGSLAVQSVEKRDYAVLQSCVLIMSAAFIVVSLLVDIVCGLVDPRIRVNRHGD